MKINNTSFAFPGKATDFEAVLWCGVNVLILYSACTSLTMTRQIQEHQFDQDLHF